MTTVDLLSTHVSGSLHSTQKCGGVLLKLAGSTLGNIQLTVDELRDMVSRDGEAFSNRVLHYASSLRGTLQYWFRQRSRLISMVDTLGLPTIFFTHSAADLQWPEEKILKYMTSIRTHTFQKALSVQLDYTHR